MVSLKLRLRPMKLRAYKWASTIVYIQTSSMFRVKVKYKLFQKKKKMTQKETEK
jgi:hypothetical protein